MKRRPRELVTPSRSPHRSELSSSPAGVWGLSKGRSHSGDWTVPALSDLVKCHSGNKGKWKSFSALWWRNETRGLLPRAVERCELGDHAAHWDSVLEITLLHLEKLFHSGVSRDWSFWKYCVGGKKRSKNSPWAIEGLPEYILVRGKLRWTMKAEVCFQTLLKWIRKRVKKSQFSTLCLGCAGSINGTQPAQNQTAGKVSN